MKCIIVIRGVEQLDFLGIIESLKSQFKARLVEEKDMPLFAWLPNLEGERAEIEVVWLDPAMELEHLRMINEKISQPTPAKLNADDIRKLYSEAKAIF